MKTVYVEFILGNSMLWTRHSGNVKTLYHQTSSWAGKQILRNGTSLATGGFHQIGGHGSRGTGCFWLKVLIGERDFQHQHALLSEEQTTSPFIIPFYSTAHCPEAQIRLVQGVHEDVGHVVFVLCHDHVIMFVGFRFWKLRLGNFPTSQWMGFFRGQTT